MLVSSQLKKQLKKHLGALCTGMHTPSPQNKNPQNEFFPLRNRVLVFVGPEKRVAVAVLLRSKKLREKVVLVEEFPTPGGKKQTVFCANRERVSAFAIRFLLSKHLHNQRAVVVQTVFFC